MTKEVETSLRTNFDKVVKVAGIMLKAAEEQSATPQDVVNVLNTVVDELLAIKDALPGGEQTQAPQEPAQAPPGQQAEPSSKISSLEKDTVVADKDRVAEQNAAQQALHEKTFKALQARVDELESEKQVRAKEELATEIADTYPVAQRQAKFDEVIKSDRPLHDWEIISEARSEINSNSINVAKTQSTWIPQKNAKLNKLPRVKFIGV
jgi:hypothetical protein